VDAVCPCAERLADRIGTLRDDIFTGASELVINTLGAVLVYFTVDQGEKLRTCLAFCMVSSLRGIPSVANRASGNKDLVLFSMDATVSMSAFSVKYSS
jgi:hypothetical protein